MDVLARWRMQPLQAVYCTPLKFCMIRIINLVKCPNSLLLLTKGLWQYIFQKNVNIKFIVVDWLECPHVFLNYNAYSAISKNIMFIFKHRIHIIRILEIFPFPILVSWDIRYIKYMWRVQSSPKAVDWRLFIVD